MNTEDKDSQPTEEAAADTPTATPVKPFTFPFDPALFSPGKAADKPWQQKSAKSNHDQRPGPAPRGTRRSMGKR
jgi:hypothetical protein